MKNIVVKSTEKVFVVPSNETKTFLQNALRRGLEPTRPVQISRRASDRYAVVMLPRNANEAV